MARNKKVEGVTALLSDSVEVVAHSTIVTDEGTMEDGDVFTLDGETAQKLIARGEAEGRPIISLV